MTPALLVRIGSPHAVPHAVPHASPHCGGAMRPRNASAHCHERTNRTDERIGHLGSLPFGKATRAYAYTPGFLADCGLDLRRCPDCRLFVVRSA